MKFYVARMSFIPSKYQPLFKEDFEGKPIELAEQLLVSNPEYIPEKKRGFVSLYFGDFKFDSDGKLLAARLGKAKKVKLPKYDKLRKGFLEEKDTSYPYVYMLWDREEQVILIEKKSTVFPKYENVFRSIEGHLSRLLRKYGLSVSIAPITEKRDFWRHVESYTYIYEVYFKLYMPNLFGNTQKDLKEFLKSIKEAYNATDISTQLSNQDGLLKLSENDPEINRNLEWIEKGGGEWSITVKSDERSKKVVIRSTQNAKTVDTSIEIVNYSAEEVIAILNSLKENYSIKDRAGE